MSHVCTRCGSIGAPKTRTRGSFFIELVLWLFFLPGLVYGLWILLLPGLIYSIWRLTSRYKVCAHCGSDQLVPEHSPMGQQISWQIKQNTQPRVAQ